MFQKHGAAHSGTSVCTPVPCGLSVRRTVRQSPGHPAVGLTGAQTCPQVPVGTLVMCSHHAQWIRVMGLCAEAVGVTTGSRVDRGTHRADVLTGPTRSPDYHSGEAGRSLPRLPPLSHSVSSYQHSLQNGLLEASVDKL